MVHTCWYHPIFLLMMLIGTANLLVWKQLRMLRTPHFFFGLFHCSYVPKGFLLDSNNCKPRPSTNHSRFSRPTCCRTEVLGSTVLLRAAVCSPDEACMPRCREFLVSSTQYVTSLSKWDDCEFQGVSQSWRVKAPKKAPLFPFFGCACRCCCCCCCCCLGCCGWAYCCCMYCCCCCFCPFLPFPLPSSFPLPRTHVPKRPEQLTFLNPFKPKRRIFFWQSSIHFCPSFLIQTWIPSPRLRIYNTNHQFCSTASRLLLECWIGYLPPKSTNWVNM